MPTVFIFHLSLQEVGVEREARSSQAQNLPQSRRPTSGVPPFHLSYLALPLGPFLAPACSTEEGTYEGTRVGNLQPCTLLPEG